MRQLVARQKIRSLLREMHKHASDKALFQFVSNLVDNLWFNEVVIASLIALVSANARSSPTQEAYLKRELSAAQSNCSNLNSELQEATSSSHSIQKTEEVEAIENKNCSSNTDAALVGKFMQC